MERTHSSHSLSLYFPPPCPRVWFRGIRLVERSSDSANKSSALWVCLFVLCAGRFNGHTNFHHRLRFESRRRKGGCVGGDGRTTPVCVRERTERERGGGEFGEEEEEEERRRSGEKGEKRRVIRGKVEIPCEYCIRQYTEHIHTHRERERGGGSALCVLPRVRARAQRGRASVCECERRETGDSLRGTSLPRVFEIRNTGRKEKKTIDAAARFSLSSTTTRAIPYTDLVVPDAHPLSASEHGRVSDTGRNSR